MSDEALIKRMQREIESLKAEIERKDSERRASNEVTVELQINSGFLVTESEKILRKYEMIKELCELRYDRIKELEVHLSTYDQVKRVCELQQQQIEDLEHRLSKQQVIQRMCELRQKRITELETRLAESIENIQQF
jgi:chromosome segregation ATPase